MSTNTKFTSSLLDQWQPKLERLAIAEPETNPFDAFRLAAASHISSVLSIPLEQAFQGIEAGRKDTDINVPIPKYRIKGDPKALAQKVVDSFQPNDYLSKATATGINLSFTFKTETLAKLVVNQINELSHLQEKPAYGTNASGKGKKALVEYSSPNIAKPFHAGHLRSTIIGAFLSNLYQANGWETVRINYLGDWGKQFGILSVGFAKYGSEEELEKDAIKHLYDVYVKINADARKEVEDDVAKSRAERRAAGETDVPADDAEPTVAEKEAANANSKIHNAAREVFEKMENDDPTELALWERFRNLSIVKYKQIYKRLNIDFDVYSGESQVSREAQFAAMTKLQQSNLAIEDKGALLVDLEKYKLGKTIVRKRDGTTTYISRDIGGAEERYAKYKFDKSIYVVASQQDFHLAQLFKICELMGYEWAKKMEHINFGMVQGMSTRKGTAVFLEQILDEAKETMHEQMKKSEDKYALIEDPEYTSDVLGMSAVKIQDMAGKRINNYNFDWARMTSYLGDTGPYLQYAHVRLASIVRKATDQVTLPPYDQIHSAINTDLLSEPKAREVLLLLASYPDTVKLALKSSEPTTIVGFCWKLTHAISSAYEVLLVRDQTPDVAAARLVFYICAKDVLDGAMRLLTLTPLDRM